MIPNLLNLLNKEVIHLFNLLDLEPKEIEYWNKRGIDPNYIYDFAEEGWEQYID